MPWSRSAVLSLYKKLLREGRSLRYTDQDFYRARIQHEFRKYQHEDDPEQREFQLKSKKREDFCKGGFSNRRRRKTNMAKNKKQRGRKKFDYSKNRKRQWKKSKKKVKIGHRGVEAAWDNRKSVSQNLSDMGLSHNVNKTIPFPKTRDIMPNVYQDEGMEMDISPAKKTKKAKKLHVMKQLEEEANTLQEGTPRLSSEMVRYCTYMMDKYGEDYVAMARDVKNYYQDTPKQIRRKILRFKSIPEHYQEYLQQKETAMTS